jgi:hypothetical protein
LDGEKGSRIGFWWEKRELSKGRPDFIFKRGRRVVLKNLFERIGHVIY